MQQDSSPTDQTNQPTPDMPQQMSAIPASPAYSQPAPKMGFKFKFNPNRTNVFVAEYSIMLIMLTIVLSNLIGLAYTFCSLIVSAMNGGLSMSASVTTMFVLWMAVTSLIA